MLFRSRRAGRGGGGGRGNARNRRTPAEPAGILSCADGDFGRYPRHADRRHRGVRPRAVGAEDRVRGRGIDIANSTEYGLVGGIFTADIDAAHRAARRIRATRSLWDPTYVDESRIAEPIRLIPRMQKLIEANYPELGLSIGEYDFGGEDHMSGALALALLGTG